MVAYAGMAYGGGKHWGLGLEILGHESTVAGANATYGSGVGPLVGAAESLGALDDICSDTLAGSVDMAGGPFLTAACASARVDHKHGISLCGIEVVGYRLSKLRPVGEHPP